MTRVIKCITGAPTFTSNMSLLEVIQIHLHLNSKTRINFACKFSDNYIPCIQNMLSPCRVARTLCPQWNIVPAGSKVPLFLAIDVSSSDNEKRDFQLRADYVDNFELKENQKITANVTPSTPMYFRYTFKPTLVVSA